MQAIFNIIIFAKTEIIKTNTHSLHQLIPFIMDQHLIIHSYQRYFSLFTAINGIFRFPDICLWFGCLILDIICFGSCLSFNFRAFCSDSYEILGRK